MVLAVLSRPDSVRRATSAQFSHINACLADIRGRLNCSGVPADAAFFGFAYNECRNRVSKNMINVTPKAVNQIRQMLEDNNTGAALRLGVVGGGCSGLSYKFKFETNPRPNDNVFEVDGVQLVVDPKSYEYLNGMTLDYTESLMERAFVFQNPNAAKSCGCGKSFIV